MNDDETVEQFHNMLFNEETPAPREPSADLTAAANGVHELYVSLIRAGFTENQAFSILGTMIAVGLRGQM